MKSLYEQILELRRTPTPRPYSHPDRDGSRERAAKWNTLSSQLCDLYIAIAHNEMTDGCPDALRGLKADAHVLEQAREALKREYWNNRPGGVA